MGNCFYPLVLQGCLYLGYAPDSLLKYKPTDEMEGYSFDVPSIAGIYPFA
jgi:hypothetical protein